MNTTEVGVTEASWANMGPTWVLAAPDGPHVDPMKPYYQGSFFIRSIKYMSDVAKVPTK